MVLDKNYWIKELSLISHPEGGYYKEVFRSKGIIDHSESKSHFNGIRNHMTSIHFLLDGNNFSAFHKIKSDEMWYYHYGDPILVHIIDQGGNYSSFKLGLNINEGECLSHVVEANTWFASECLNKEGYGLVSCGVAPGFDFEDFELANEKLLDLYPQHNELIKRLLH